jgi:hypothetical protein
MRSRAWTDRIGHEWLRSRALRPLLLAHLLVCLHLNYELEVDGCVCGGVLGLAHQQAAGVFVHTAVSTEREGGMKGERESERVREKRERKRGSERERERRSERE